MSGVAFSHAVHSMDAQPTYDNSLHSCVVGDKECGVLNVMDIYAKRMIYDVLPQRVLPKQLIRVGTAESILSEVNVSQKLSC